jgi:hypothetical protein
MTLNFRVKESAARSESHALGWMLCQRGWLFSTEPHAAKNLHGVRSKDDQRHG